jgi:hypothetical protein
MPADAHATLSLPGLSPATSKPIVARFDGGSLSSDGGLTRQAPAVCAPQLA